MELIRSKFSLSPRFSVSSLFSTTRENDSNFFFLSSLNYSKIPFEAGKVVEKIE